MLNVGSNNTNFKSRPIYPANIRKISEAGEKGIIKATFSELERNNPEDVKTIEKIQNSWNDCFSYNYCRSFLNNKDPNNKYYALEIDVKEFNLYQKIVGVINSSLRNNLLNIALLQTKSMFAHNTQNPNAQRKISGIGENLLLGNFKIAKEENKEKIRLVSACDGFYDKSFEEAKLDLNEIKEPYSYYEIKNDLFDKYINFIREKYKS